MAVQACARHRQRIAVVGRQQNVNPVSRILAVVRGEHRVRRELGRIICELLARIEYAVSVVVDDPAREFVIRALTHRNFRDQALDLNLREAVAFVCRSARANHLRIVIAGSICLDIRRRTERRECPVRARQVV